MKERLRDKLFSEDYVDPLDYADDGEDRSDDDDEIYFEEPETPPARAPRSESEDHMSTWKCEKCDKFFSSSGFLARHARDMHGKAAPVAVEPVAEEPKPKRAYTRRAVGAVKKRRPRATTPPPTTDTESAAYTLTDMQFLALVLTAKGIELNERQKRVLEVVDSLEDDAA